MSEPARWLHVLASGREILVAAADLREVVEAGPVALLPGRPKGVDGVVIHQGEFLPVLAWSDLPGCAEDPGVPMALAVLRPRLGILLQRIIGMVQIEPESWSVVPENDPCRPWISRMGRLDGRDLPVLDLDRLISLLHRFRNEH